MSIARPCPYDKDKTECKYEKHWFHPRLDKCPTCDRMKRESLERNCISKGVTMFKTEAEKYRSDLIQGLIDKIRQGYNCKELSDIELAFQKGADCGYDKANEWHSVYDELPKENKKYWVLTSNGEPKVDDWVSVSWAYSDDIVAWKEIIYPKEILSTNVKIKQ